MTLDSVSTSREFQNRVSLVVWTIDLAIGHVEKEWRLPQDREHFNARSSVHETGADFRGV